MSVNQTFPRDGFVVGRGRAAGHHRARSCADTRKSFPPDIERHPTAIDTFRV